MATLTMVAAVALPQHVNATPTPDWVSFSSGKLHYRSDAQGNRVPDFSHVGYHAGQAQIPDLPTQVTLAPTGGDDTASIQNALNAVAKSGKPGAVQLKQGTYRIDGTIRLNASGVVLRGSGSGPKGTTLSAEGTPHPLVEMGGDGSRQRVGDAVAVTDDYVPVGADSLHVADSRAFARGDHVIVQRPQEQDWIHQIGMDAIPPRPDGKPDKPWSASDGLLFDRAVTSVDGQTLHLDAPLTNALEKQFTHATVWKYSFDGRIHDAGLEHLSAEGVNFVKSPNWHDGGFFKSTLVQVGAAADSWVRDVIANHFGSAFEVQSDALQISMIDTKSLDPEAQAVPQDIHDQPAAYSVSGQQTLITNCEVTGSNLHAWITQAAVPGPNVFSRCRATNTGKRILDAGPHQRWATGTLYDDITSAGTIELADRQWMGSGQGWAGANSVLWNCAVSAYKVENPPTAYNWAVGCNGKRQSPSGGHPLGELQSDGTHVSPESLYEEQLRERR